MLHCVITTIQEPTSCMLKLATSAGQFGMRLVIAGDVKGPSGYDLSSVSGFDDQCLDFLSIDRQAETGFRLANSLPTGHYCRKNIGYLQAIANNASCIYETDDDNRPLPQWRPRNLLVSGPRLVRSRPADGIHWVNVYQHFTPANIWPRGLPLSCINDPDSQARGATDAVPADDQDYVFCCPIQQSLVNGSPDVDAIWRLVFGDEFAFEANPSVLLRPGQWCPFNTQSTWWWPEAYPLMYVPVHCPFRMCDIWRSFVAQRCLWAMGYGVLFHAPEVVQERNDHRLMDDFEDEISGYLQNESMVRLLDGLELRVGSDAVTENLRRCYDALVKANIFPQAELTHLDAWIADVSALQRLQRPVLEARSDAGEAQASTIRFDSPGSSIPASGTANTVVSPQPTAR